MRQTNAHLGNGASTAYHCTVNNDEVNNRLGQARCTQITASCDLRRRTPDTASFAQYPSKKRLRQEPRPA